MNKLQIIGGKILTAEDLEQMNKEELKTRKIEFIPIDFHAIAKEHGVTKGTIFFSKPFQRWVLSGHPDINLICIKPPHKIGDEVDGKTVHNVTIKDNKWCIEYQ